MKLKSFVVPVIVPFQSRPSALVQVPVTLLPAWVRFMSIADVVKFDASKLPVQLPATFAAGRLVGEVGLRLQPTQRERENWEITEGSLNH